MTEPKDHKLPKEYIIFCGEYKANHILNKRNPISEEYVERYASILGWETKDPLVYKREYNSTKEMFEEQMEYNIQYCEKRLEKDKLKKKKKSI